MESSAANEGDDDAGNDEVDLALHSRRRAATLPIFPIFERLSPDVWASYRERYEKLSAPYCDFSLNNLLIWLDQRDDVALSVAGECVVLRFSSVFDNNRRRYSLFGTGNVDCVVREVLSFIAAQRKANCAWCLPKPWP